jgi:hypothetical protein
MDILLWAGHLFFLVFHTLLTLFNAVGWLVPRWRRAHLMSILATAFAWFGIGLFYTLGYCPLTHWHFLILRAMGEHDLPPGFIEYVIELAFATDVATQTVRDATLWGFLIALAGSLVMNFRRRRAGFLSRQLFRRQNGG